MKKHILFSAVIALIATACTFTTEEIEIAIGRKIESFTGRIDNEQSRTTSAGSGNNLIMLWHEDDQIAVTDRVYVAKYDLTEGVGTTSGEFALNAESSGVTFSEGAELYGVVPYMSAYYEGNPLLPGLEAEEGESWGDVSESRTAHLKGRLNIIIPTEQMHGAKGSNDYDRNIMVGKITDDGTTFDFKQVGSLVRFSITLPSAQTIYSAKIIAEEDMHIAGRCIVDTGAERVAILEATHNELTLYYSNPVEATTSTDGWAIIAPVDWTSSTGKVYYEIATSEGVYTFCKRPAKAFEVGKIYNLPLNVSKFTFKEGVSATELEDGDYTYTKNAFSMAVVNTTDSTATIAWTITATNTEIGTPAVNANNDFTLDYSKSYKVALYRDSKCSDLVVSVDGFAGTLLGALPPRFVFPALQPQTTYYAKVWNTTDGVESRPLRVTTKAAVASRSDVVSENAKAGDMILYENFEKLIYAGDVAFSAAGVTYKWPTNATTAPPVSGEIVHGINKYNVVNQEHGLFNNFAKSINAIGLAGWGWIGGKADANGGSVCMRSGYLKIGAGSNCAFVCTPALTAIPEGKYARVKVHFKAAPIEKAMAVKALSAAELNADHSMSYSAECDVKTLTLSGTQAYDWEEYEVTLNDLPHGGCVAIGGNANPTTTCRLQIDDLRIVVEDIYDLSNIITGTVSDQNGSPIAGVAVSDGFSVARTDSNGHYSLQTCEDTYYIYYSTPADCVVSQNEHNQPAFYTKYSAEQTVYDFTLTKMESGAESQFSLFVLADPQVRDTKEIGYFRNETVPAFNTHAATKASAGVPCYGVALGDIVYSEYGGRAPQNTPNTQNLMEPMRDEMKSFNIPVFQTIGNHDYTYFGPDDANKTNLNQWPGSSFQIKTQRAFEDMFGPINYSWNRGDAHIIHMRNIYFTEEAESALKSGKYVMGFTDEQYEWLKQDLQFVPVDKLIIFCVHIPVWNRVGNDFPNGANVVNLLRRYTNLRILSGHNHYMRYRECYKNVKEHTIAAVCGAWWSSKTNGDGAPNGYGVFDINGTTVTNQYYMSVNQTDDAANRDHQIRIYRGDLKCGNASNGNYFELKHGSNVILANVFNACKDAGWEVKIYENDTAYDMTYVTEKVYMPGGENNISAPSGFLNWYTPVDAPTDSNQDWWAIAYRVCMAGLTGDASFLNCFHMYKHTIQNTNATIRVEATDPYGRTYTQTDIIENGDDIYASIRR